MPIKLLEKKLNIFTFPTLDSDYPIANTDELTIGDLHGNAIKLLYFLIKQSIVKNIDSIDYNKLINIYKKPVAKLEKQDLNLFKNILKKIKCTKNQNSIVRLIGDELADRGNNDYFTLKILQKLHERGVGLEILLSNHSAEFIKAYEIQQLNSHNKFVSQNLDSRFITSMINLQILMDKKLIDKKEVFSIYQTVYKPNLKLISYTLHSKNKAIVLYTHAPAGLEAVKLIASELDIDYKDGKLAELTQTIDKINNEFQEKYVQENNIRDLLEIENPVYSFIWNREYKILERPEQKSGYKLSFVHGHDSREPSQKNIYSLDTDLGKCVSCNKGEYSVFRITEDQESKPEKKFTKKIPKEEIYSPKPYDPTWLPPHVSQDITILMQYANTCPRVGFFRYKDMINPITPAMEVLQSTNDAILTLTGC